MRKLLHINEIFFSIQGESSRAGLPCIFVRLTGCNYRCRYCDTDYAYEEGRVMAIEEIVDIVKSFPCSLVEITGGEPLLQGETPSLVVHLLELGFDVMLETNGSLPIDLIDSRCHRIVDFKCPDSGEAEGNDWGNIKRLKELDEVKFVLSSRTDFDFACKTLQRITRENPPFTNIALFSPNTALLEPRLLAEWILQSGIRVRLQMQLHKLLWRNSRGC